jgi:hypothetical protein
MSNKGVKESSLIKKLKTRKIIRNATRAAAKPITLEEIKAIHVNGLLTFEAFTENIGKIFPFIIECVSSGMKIRAIERYIGMKERMLEQYLQRHPRLMRDVQNARKIRLDDNVLEAIVD